MKIEDFPVATQAKIRETMRQEDESRTASAPPAGQEAPGATKGQETDPSPPRGDRKIMRLRRVRTDDEKMTVAEREFAAICDRQKKDGVIEWARPWGISLLWGGGQRYTPDFVVKHQDSDRLTLLEVKGKRFFRKDITRFRGCKEAWKDVFDFELRQRLAAGMWEKIL